MVLPFLDTGSRQTRNINAIGDLGEVLAEHGALFIVDGVSSIGSTEFYGDRWQVDIAITVSQKGLLCPPGLNLVSVSAKAWKPCFLKWS
jgi:aspartate aminotransferase-like enzyme